MHSVPNFPGGLFALGDVVEPLPWLRIINLLKSLFRRVKALLMHLPRRWFRRRRRFNESHLTLRGGTPVLIRRLVARMPPYIPIF